MLDSALQSSLPSTPVAEICGRLPVAVAHPGAASHCCVEGLAWPVRGSESSCSSMPHGSNANREGARVRALAGISRHLSIACEALDEHGDHRESLGIRKLQLLKEESGRRDGPKQMCVCETDRQTDRRTMQVNVAGVYGWGRRASTHLAAFAGADVGVAEEEHVRQALGLRLRPRTAPIVSHAPRPEHEQPWRWLQNKASDAPQWCVHSARGCFAWPPWRASRSSPPRPTQPSAPAHTHHCIITITITTINNSSSCLVGPQLHCPSLPILAADARLRVWGTALLPLVAQPLEHRVHCIERPSVAARVRHEDRLV